ncbi:hypothetical protein [Variovorax sp. dw_308]|uniref:hypothetical protein n=1 Tax=Variovorax sp. dw_308 TaxID=2721546 RepID=UPI001C461D93|nr:hypothetical protein [Variovorax sp. dw_308]
MFRLRSAHRCFTIFVVMLSLLFSQLALAGYSCPAMAAPESMAERMARGAPCEGSDEAQPVLCHQHAVNASQSFEPAKPVTPSLPIVVQVLPAPTLVPMAEGLSLPLANEPDQRPPPDPVFLATRRLRV